MYKVIVPFMDLQDNNHVYRKGNTYPRSGYTPTKKRISELSSGSNRRGVPLIENPVSGQGSPSSAVDGISPAVNTPNGQKAKREPRKSQDD